MLKTDTKEAPAKKPPEETLPEAMPMPDTGANSGGIPVKPEPPHRIFISYIAGTKFQSMVLKTAVPDIDTELLIMEAARVLSKSHNGKNITILFWRALDG